MQAGPCLLKKKDKCAKCGMSNTGCCKDEKKQFKLTLDQQKTAVGQILSLPIIAANQNSAICNAVTIFTIDRQNLAYLHGPPIIPQKDIQAFFSTYLI